MDDKELQLKEKELEIANKRQKLDEKISRQENLRRAIEVGSNCYLKFNTDKIKESLQDLVLTAIIKLKEEISN